jgi:hypothetical protein
MKLLHRNIVMVDVFVGFLCEFLMNGFGNVLQWLTIIYNSFPFLSLGIVLFVPSAVLQNIRYTTTSSTYICATVSNSTTTGHVFVLIRFADRRKTLDKGIKGGQKIRWKATCKVLWRNIVSQYPSVRSV